MRATHVALLCYSGKKCKEYYILNKHFDFTKNHAKLR